MGGIENVASLEESEGQSWNRREKEDSWTGWEGSFTKQTGWADRIAAARASWSGRGEDKQARHKLLLLLLVLASHQTVERKCSRAKEKKKTDERIGYWNRTNYDGRKKEEKLSSVSWCILVLFIFVWWLWNMSLASAEQNVLRDMISTFRVTELQMLLGKYVQD